MNRWHEPRPVEPALARGGVRRGVAVLAVDSRGGRKVDHAGLVVGVRVVHAPVARRRQGLADHVGTAGDVRPWVRERSVGRGKG